MCDEGEREEGGGQTPEPAILHTIDAWPQPYDAWLACTAGVESLPKAVKSVSFAEFLSKAASESSLVFH